MIISLLKRKYQVKNGKTHLLAHSLTHSFSTHSLPLTHSLSPTRSLSLSFSHSLIFPLTHLLTLPLTHSLIHSLTHSLSLSLSLTHSLSHPPSLPGLLINLLLTCDPLNVTDAVVYGVGTLKLLASNPQLRAELETGGVTDLVQYYLEQCSSLVRPSIAVNNKIFLSSILATKL